MFRLRQVSPASAGLVASHHRPSASILRLVDAGWPWIDQMKRLQLTTPSKQEVNKFRTFRTWLTCDDLMIVMPCLQNILPWKSLPLTCPTPDCDMSFCGTAGGAAIIPSKYLSFTSFSTWRGLPVSAAKWLGRLALCILPLLAVKNIAVKSVCGVMFVQSQRVGR